MGASFHTLVERARSLWDRDRRARTIAGLVLLVAIFVPINLAMYYWTGVSSLKPLQLWLMVNDLTFDDSWLPMRTALNWIRTGPDGSLYDEVFFGRHVKFQYALTSLLPLAGLGAVGLGSDAVVLNRISRLLLLLSAVGVGTLTWILLKRSSDGEQSDSLTPDLAALVVGGAAFLFYPLTHGYAIGQVQVWINALFIFACLAWVLEWRGVSGGMLGLICLLKPQFTIFVLWGLLRREWRFAAVLVATGAVGLTASVLLFGLQNNIEYLKVISYISRHGEAILANQSFNGLLHRMVGNDDGLVWNMTGFPTFHPTVFVLTALSSVVILLIGLWPGERLSGLGGLLQFQLAAVAFTIASPLAWEPNYGVLAPTFAALFCFVLAMPCGQTRRAWLMGLAAAFTLSANPFGFVRFFAHTPLLVLQSYLLFAGLGVMAMLWRATKILGPGLASQQTAPIQR
jgi:alpha-1,2-mannosyltransferase